MMAPGVIEQCESDFLWLTDLLLGQSSHFFFYDEITGGWYSKTLELNNTTHDIIND